MNLKTIFFDAYQTLISVDDSGNEEAWNIFSEFMNNRGVFIDAAQFQEMLSEEKRRYYRLVKDSKMKLRHHNLFDIINTTFTNFKIKVKEEELLDLIWQFRQAYYSDVKLYHGVANVLQELSQKYILVIASYTQGSYTYKELEKLSIARYFSNFVFSSDIGYRKTDQEFYKICLQKTNNTPEECLMVGDNYLQDVVIPKRVGLKAVLIRNPLTDNKNILDDVKPDGIIKLEDMVTLPSIIESIS